MTKTRSQPSFHSLYTATIIAAAALTARGATEPAATFPLPLKDGTTANAAFLPTQNGQAYLVYATSTGQLGSYLLTPTNSPNPQPPAPTPTPPAPPPPPPAPPLGTASRLIAIGETQEPNLPAKLTTLLAEKHITTQTYSVAQVQNPNTPPTALHWIGLTAGKPYPYGFLLTASAAILWQGPIPTNPDDAISIFNRYSPQPAQKSTCPNGFCPQRRWR